MANSSTEHFLHVDGYFKNFQVQMQKGHDNGTFRDLLSFLGNRGNTKYILNIAENNRPIID